MSEAYAFETSADMSLNGVTSNRTVFFNGKFGLAILGMGRGSSVTIVTSLHTGPPKNLDSILGRDKGFISTPKTCGPALKCNNLLNQWLSQILSLGVK